MLFRSAGAWYDLGLLLFRLGRDRQALGALQAALCARPDYQAAKAAVARIAGFSAHRRVRAKRRELAPRVDNSLPGSQQE